MYSPRLYKYRDSYVLYIPTVHAFGSVLFTHTILVQTHTHDVSAPWCVIVSSNSLIMGRHVRFTTVPSKTLSDYERKIYPFLSLYKFIVFDCATKSAYKET